MKLFQPLAEGGQTWAHRVRMVRQVIKIALGLSFLSILIYVFYALSSLEPLLLQSGYYHLKGEVNHYFSLDDISVSAEFWEKVSHEKVNAKEKIVPFNRLKILTQTRFRSLLSECRTIALQSINVALFTFGGMLLFFLARGTASKRKHHVSGKKLIHSWLLHLKLTLKRKASDIKIGALPLVKGTETQHILVTGGTGSGKTNCFHHILPQVRSKKQKAIIIDTTGILLEKYYNPQKDFILNPFDSRGSEWNPWNPWTECEDFFDYDNLSESII